MVAVGDLFYRFDETAYVDGSVEVHMARYYMVRETPKGWWLSCWREGGGGDIWVSKTAHKRHAYPTQEEAIESFRARKRAQLRHAKRSEDIANAALRAVSEACAENEYKTTPVRSVFPGIFPEDAF